MISETGELSLGAVAVAEPWSIGQWHRTATAIPGTANGNGNGAAAEALGRGRARRPS